VLACDMPMISSDAIRWLLAQQDMGELCGVVPYNRVTRQVEPLFALYRAEAYALFMEIKQQGRFVVSQIDQKPGIASPSIPESLIGNWQNINTPEEMHNM